MAKLKRFNKNENRGLKKALLIVSICLVVSLVISATMTYAVYQKEVEIPFINARVGEFTVNDIQLAMLLDGEEVEAPPEKNSLYTVTVDCDNATGRWDMNEWAAVVGNITSGKVKCEVNFTTPEPTISEVIVKPYTTSIELTYTSGGINTKAICKYGTEEGNYANTIEEATNSNCSITGLEKGITYYYQVCAKNGGGEIGKTGSTKTYPLSEQVKVGDYISMTPTSTSYTLPNELSGCDGTSSTCVQNTINPSELNLWRVIRKNEDGTVDMVSEYVSTSRVYFYGRLGYKNFIKALNTIAGQYTDGVHVQSTRIMGYKNQSETCSPAHNSSCINENGAEEDNLLVEDALGTTKATTVTGEPLSYWLPVREYSDTYSPVYWYKVRHNGSALLASGGTVIYTEEPHEQVDAHGVRPVVTLKSTIGIASGSGTQSSPYILA